MNRRAALTLAGLTALTWLAYLPVWHAGFVWNDPDYVTRPALRSLAGLWLIWTKPGATEQYYPLLHTAFWVQHRLWGNAALGYHLVGLGLHTANAFLFGALLSTVFARAECAGKVEAASPPLSHTYEAAGQPARRSQAKEGRFHWAAWFAAALFAVHPVMVESVAWISEQKNTLSLLFYLLAARCYLRATWENRRGAYAIGLIFFLCALLCKTVTATLPAALLMLLWWLREPLAPSRKNPLTLNHWLRLLPWLLIGGAAGLFSGWVERTYVGAQGGDFSLSMLQRVLVAARAPWFYLSKLLWPAHLVFIYPHWSVLPTHAIWWLFLATTVATTAICTLFATRRGWRGPLAAWLLFLGGLFPTLGFLNVYAFIYSYVADHWNYLSALPIFAAAAWLLARWTGSWLPLAKVLAATALLAALGARAWQECEPYNDAGRFYLAIAERNPDAWLAQNNLADLLIDQGSFQAALPLLDASLRARPNAPATLFNRGKALHNLHRLQPALRDLAAALALQPRFPRAQAELARTETDAGAAALDAGEFKSASQLLADAIRREPDLAIAWAAMGRLLFGERRLPLAQQALEEALHLKPNYPEAENNLGAVFMLMGRPAEAIPHYEAALRLRPDYSDAERNLAAARSASSSRTAPSSAPQ